MAGTVSISARTLSAIIADIAQSLEQSGISKVVLVNGRGGNDALSNVVQEANVCGKRMALSPAGGDWNAARSAAHLESSTHEDMHAGEIETSILLHAHPELVRDGCESADWTSNDRKHLLVNGMAAYTSSGVSGRPSLGSADKGKMALASSGSGAGAGLAPSGGT